MYASRTDAVDALMCKELRKGAWPGEHCQGMEPRRTHRGGNGKSQGLHKESRGNTAPPQRKERNLRESKGIAQGTHVASLLCARLSLYQVTCVPIATLQDG